MRTVSRNNHLKIPKVLEDFAGKINSADDELATMQAVAMANNEKFERDKMTKEIEQRDREWEQITKIPEAASDMLVITVVKKLVAYIIAITEKSPAKFRGVFVNRMQNFGLETLQNLLQANFLRLDSPENKKQRENFQQEAIIKLKMLSYIAMVAENAGCILARQYKQISIQTAEAINLIAAWKNSDDERWKIKQDFKPKGF